MDANYFQNAQISNEIIFGENIKILKRIFLDQSSNYEKGLQMKAEKFDENDAKNFKSFLFNFLRDNSQLFEEAFLKTYKTKAQTFDDQVI